ncbi:hypothetical protein [Enterococcus sp. AZ163]|uniref:hypothetical protein n=1 Tax=Enterococcus sp. AZ163 TaxID=2774638 RepID=UPI003D2661F0
MGRDQIKTRFEQCNTEIEELRMMFRKSKNTTAREAITLQIKNLEAEKLKHRIIARAQGIDL